MATETFLGEDINKSSEAPNERIRGAGGVRPMTKPTELLDIAKDIQFYIDGKGWSWCDMDRVYRILKMVNG